MNGPLFKWWSEKWTIFVHYSNDDLNKGEIQVPSPIITTKGTGHLNSRWYDYWTNKIQLFSCFPHLNVRYSDPNCKFFNCFQVVLGTTVGIWIPTFLKFQFQKVRYWNDQFMCCVLCTRPAIRIQTYLKATKPPSVWDKHPVTNQTLRAFTQLPRLA